MSSEELDTTIWTTLSARSLADILNAHDSPLEAEALPVWGDDCYAVARKRSLFDNASMEPVYRQTPDVLALYKQVWPSGFDEPQSEIQLDVTLREARAKDSLINELFAYLTVKQVPFLAAAADLEEYRWNILLAFDPMRPSEIPRNAQLYTCIPNAPHNQKP